MANLSGRLTRMPNSDKTALPVPDPGPDPPRLAGSVRHRDGAARFRRRHAGGPGGAPRRAQARPRGRARSDPPLHRGLRAAAVGAARGDRGPGKRPRQAARRSDGDRRSACAAPRTRSAGSRCASTSCMPNEDGIRRSLYAAPRGDGRGADGAAAHGAHAAAGDPVAPRGCARGDPRLDPGGRGAARHPRRGGGALRRSCRADRADRPHRGGARLARAPATRRSARSRRASTFWSPPSRRSASRPRRRSSAERNKAEELASRAGTLQSLIESLEIGGGRRGEGGGGRRRRRRAQTPPADRNEAARRLADTSRMAPAVRFADARGLLAWPVSGEKVLGFGDPDEFGGEVAGAVARDASRIRRCLHRPTDGCSMLGRSAPTGRC